MNIIKKLRAIGFATLLSFATVGAAFATITVIPGGPYTINEGQSITLTDGGSSSTDAAISGFDWDINNDTIIDATGSSATIGWNILESLIGTSSIANNTLIFPITLTITDGSGNISSGSSTINVLNTLPSTGAFLIGTSANEYISGNTTISRTGITDVANGDILTSTLYYDSGAGLVMLASGATSSFTSYIRDTTTVGNGTYTLFIVGSDDTGSTTGVINFPVIVDNSTPQIATGNASINEGDTVILDLASLTTSFSPIMQYTFDINNDNTADIINTGGIATLTWAQLQSYGIINNNASLIPTDIYTIHLTAKNSVGNIGSGAYNLKVYNLAPVVTIDTPNTTGTTYTGSVSINWTITDPADGDFPMNIDVFYSNNGTTYTPIATTTSNRTGGMLWSTLSIPDGTGYTLRVRATDDFGNNQKTSTSFTIDHTPPVVTGQTSYTIAEGSGVTFTVSATDPISGVSGFMWNINSNLTGTTTGALSLTWAQLQSYGINNDGTYTIPLTVTDHVGNAGITNITLVITNTAPKITVSQPVAAIYSGTSTIAWSATDPANADLPLKIVLTYSNGITAGTIVSGTAITNPYTRNTSIIPDGTGYTVTAYAYDDDTVSTGVSQTFSIDHTAPVITGFASPYTINEGTGFIINLSGTKDNLAGLSGGQAGFNGTINGIALPTSTNGYWNLPRASLATYGITNGVGQILPITITVKDSVGNASSLTGTITILNVAPTITVNSPTTSTITGTITIGRTTYDPVDLTSGDVAYSTGATGPWTILQSGFTKSLTGIARDTLTTADGPYYIRIRATDDMGTTTIVHGPTAINNYPTVGYIGGQGGVGGGGGGSSSNIDYCPNGDYSASKYDVSCGIAPTTSGANTTGLNTGTTLTNPFATGAILPESLSAYEFAYKHGITSYESYDNAMPYGVLYRKDAAKIMVQFAKLIGKNTITHTTGCNYKDANDLNPYTVKFINESCSLGIMGLNADGSIANVFNPHSIVTRAQFGTMLSRLLYGNTNNVPLGGSIEWYTNHLNALKTKNIITDISQPTKGETRLYVWTMLMRAYNTTTQ